MKLIFCKTFFVFLFFFTTVFANEKNYFKEEKYFNWTVYSNKNKILCYIISEPIKSEGKYKLRGRVNLLVGRRAKEKKKNFVAVGFGYPFKKGTVVEVVVDKKYFFKLNTFDETAWTNGSKIKNLDDLIIKEMIKGNKLVALGFSKKGTATKDFYSLKGFSKAFKKIKQVCG